MKEDDDSTHAAAEAEPTPIATVSSDDVITTEAENDETKTEDDEPMKEDDAAAEAEPTPIATVSSDAVITTEAENDETKTEDDEPMKEDDDSTHAAAEAEPTPIATASSDDVITTEAENNETDPKYTSVNDTQDTQTRGAEEEQIEEPDEQKKILLSLPRHRGEISDRYYFTGLHYWVYKSTDLRRVCVCHHCGAVKSFSTAESFKKSISHLTLHLLNDCIQCPEHIKLDLERACMEKNTPVVSTSSFAMELWKRPLPLLNGKSLPATNRAAATTKRNQRSTRDSGPRSRSARKRLVRSATNTAEDGCTRSERRPQRSAAVAALANLCYDDSKIDEEIDEESNLNHDFTPGMAGDGPVGQSQLPESQVRAVHGWKEENDLEEGEDPFGFCEDGSYPLIKVFRTVTKYGKNQLRRAFEQKNKQKRVPRIRKIVQCIEDSMNRGYDAETLIKILEEIRGKLSLYSFADNVGEFVEKAQGLIDQGGVSKGSHSLPTTSLPKLLNESDPTDYFIEERAFLYHDPKTSAECRHLHEEPEDQLGPLPPAQRLEFDLDNLHFADKLSIKWSFDRELRLVLLDFHKLTYDQLSRYDLAFFTCLLERDDITVISEGLLDVESLDPDLWDLNVSCLELGSFLLWHSMCFDDLIVTLLLQPFSLLEDRAFSGRKGSPQVQEVREA